MDLPAFGKIVIGIGVVLVLVGFILVAGPKIPWIGRMPGDIVVRKEHFTFYFPIVTCLVVSVVLTILFRLFGHK